MEAQRTPERVVAIYGTLTATEGAFHALQDMGIPASNIQMEVHTAAEQVSLPQTVSIPDTYWSLVVSSGDTIDQAIEVLQQHQPLAVGRRKVATGVDDVDQGSIAWGHYVFETSAATDQATDAAGTAGTTGIISSGVFSQDALAEGRPQTNDTSHQ